MMSPGGKMKQSHTKQSIYAASQHQSLNNSMVSNPTNNVDY